MSALSRSNFRKYNAGVCWLEHLLTLGGGYDDVDGDGGYDSSSGGGASIITAGRGRHTATA